MEQSSPDTSTSEGSAQENREKISNNISTNNGEEIKEEDRVIIDADQIQAIAGQAAVDLDEYVII